MYVKFGSVPVITPFDGPVSTTKVSGSLSSSRPASVTPTPVSSSVLSGWSATVGTWFQIICSVPSEGSGSAEPALMNNVPNGPPSPNVINGPFPLPLATSRLMSNVATVPDTAIGPAESEQLNTVDVPPIRTRGVGRDPP